MNRLNLMVVSEYKGKKYGVKVKRWTQSKG